VPEYLKPRISSGSAAPVCSPLIWHVCEQNNNGKCPVVSRSVIEGELAERRGRGDMVELILTFERMAMPRRRRGRIGAREQPVAAAARASVTWCQAVAHAMSTLSAADEYSTERSRTANAAEIETVVVGESNMPRRSACTSGRKLEARRPVCPRAASRFGAQRAGRVGARCE
jgi:hypothetical protein